jgi:hypothetical protein
MAAPLGRKLHPARRKLSSHLQPSPDKVTAVAVSKNPATPDKRYFVVRGRLWRLSNPSLSENTRAELVKELMSARRDKGVALRAGDRPAVAAARLRVEAAKRQLGERGPVWWLDGAPDLNRRTVKNTQYASWYDSLQKQ